MYSKVCWLILLSLCIFSSGSNAEECVPQSVENLSLNAYQFLTWTVRETEVCEIKQFLVQIWQVEFPQEYTFTVTETQADVSFLELCEEWTFLVTAISESASGPGRRLIQKLPIHADANITLAYLNLTSDDSTGDIHLEWELAERKPDLCYLLYIVSIEQEGSPTIQDVYTGYKFLDLHFLSPCNTYKFSVKAYNSVPPTIEGPSKSAEHVIPPIRQGPPYVYNISAGVNEVNVTWQMESYVRNSCRVTEFRVDDVNGSFNFYYPIDIFQRGIVTTLGPLEPDTEYTVRAYAHNTAGWSSPSEVTFRTLEAMSDNEST